MKELFIKNFIARGYPYKYIKEAITKCLKRNHDAMPNNVKKKVIPLIIEFDSRFPEVGKLLKQNQQNVNDPFLTRVQNDNRMLVAYKNRKNVRTLTTRSSLTIDKLANPIAPYHQNLYLTSRILHCNQRGCRVCPNLWTKNAFISFSTGFRIPILHRMSCDTTGIIYVLHCKTCNKQYVGETKRSLKLRMRNHRSEFNNTVTQYRSPLYRHADSHGCFKFYIIPIDIVGEKERELRRRETYWIYRIKTFIPYGLNSKTH